MDRKPQSWWQTLPGILKAVATVITAATGLIIALSQAGIFSNGDTPDPPSNATNTNAPSDSEQSSANATNSEETAKEAMVEKVQLSFWYGWTGPEGEALEKLIKTFNDTHPNIQVTGLSQSDYQKQLSAITGGNPPDIASQFGQNAASWGVKGAMLPLDDFIKKEDGVDLKDFVPSALSISQYEGKTYALPIAMHVPMLFYNKDLLKGAGLDGPPKTIADLKTYMDKLTVVKDDKRLERLGMWPGINTYTFSQMFYTFTQMFGGTYWDPGKKEVTPEAPGFKQAVELYKSMWDKYGTENLDRFSASLGTYMSAQDPFFNGKYAMTMDREWLPTFIKQYAPNLNYGIAPIPYDESNPELKNPGNISTSILYIPKGVKHPRQSWEFLKWLTEKEQMVKLTATLANLPTRLSALDDPAYNDVPGFKEFTAYAKSAHLISFPSLPFLNEYNDEIMKQVNDILRGKVNIDQGLKNIKDNIQPMVT